MVLMLLLFSLLAACVRAQLPIPGKPPGFTYGRGSAAAGVQLETYIDLLCPDSKSAYPGLKKLAEHYDQSQFRLNFVLFPLPYHQHAFATAEAAFTITSALGDDHFIPWLETMYANQDMFWNKATKDMTPMQVTDKLYQLAKQTFPSLTTEQWKKGMTGYGGTDTDAQTRVAWKYTCARGMSGTPMYTLNGVPFGDADANWRFEDWKKVIDPLVQANVPVDETRSIEANMVQLGGKPRLPDRQVIQFATTSLAMVCQASDVRPCEFLPGRAMCCRAHEACILRTGCVALE